MPEVVWVASALIGHPVHVHLRMPRMKRSLGATDDSAGVDDAEKKQNIDLPDPSKLTSCSRDDITTFVKNTLRN